jgi:hypothetical protein
MAPNDVTDKNSIEVWNNIYKTIRVVKRPLVEAGDKVRVLIKEKAFQKKYKPRWSKIIYTVTQRRGRYYYIDGLQRKYLRAHILKVNKSERPEIKPLLENTLEGRLKDLAKLPVRERETLNNVEIPPIPQLKLEKRKPVPRAGPDGLYDLLSKPVTGRRVRKVNAKYSHF